MPRYKLTLEYDGRPFVGWQRQVNGPSVQQALEEAIAAFTGTTVTVEGAGRTDAGVHARGQVAHVDIAKAMTAHQVMMATNHHLRPHPIAVVACDAAPDDFHARFSALKRGYRYRIVNRRAPLTVDRGLAWHVIAPLDADAMRQAARFLIGTHDFTTFRHVHCQAKSPTKTLDRLDVARQADDIIIGAEARSFLHHQVRSIVGCLKLVGEGKWSGDDIRAALQARDRSALGLNAPPDGLYFSHVRYQS